MVGKGEGFISGLPVEIAGRAAVAHSTWAWTRRGSRDRRICRELGLLARAEPAEADSGSITIEQFYGKYRVNEYKIGYPHSALPVSV